MSRVPVSKKGPHLVFGHRSDSSCPENPLSGRRGSSLSRNTPIAGERSHLLLVFHSLALRQDPLTWAPTCTDDVCLLLLQGAARASAPAPV